MKETAKAVPNIQLRRERNQRCFSQEQVAILIGTTSFNVSRWERGVTSPSAHFRQKLCALFGRSPEELGFVQPEEQAHPHEQGTIAKFAPGGVLYDPAIPPSLDATHGLLGRDALLHNLRLRLRKEEGYRGGALALRGLPGVGKTALAIEIAHDQKVMEAFPEGILWAGLGREPNVVGLLGRWGRLLGVAPAEMARLSDVESWAKAIRAAIGWRRLLIIIDDAWRVEHALAFKVGSASCVHVLTTRFPEIALHFAGSDALQIQELNEDDGIALLERLAPGIVATEPGEVQTLVRLVGGLPLGLTLIGNYLRIQAHSGQPRRLKTALQRLQSADERLRLAQPQSPIEISPSLSSGAELSLQTIIDVSDQELDENAANALRALAVFPPKPNTFSEEAAQAVCALPVEVLDTLTDAGLLEGGGPGRYRLHQTIADYARLHANDPAASERMVRFFVSFVADHQDDYSVLEQESDNIHAVLEVAFEQRMWQALVKGATIFAPFLEVRGLYASAERHLRRAQQAASELHDTPGSALIWLHLARIEEFHGDPALAVQFAQEGLEVARSVDDRELICALLAYSGEVTQNRGENDLAKTYLLEGLALARALGNRQRICALLRNLGEIADNYGDYARSGLYYQEGLTLAYEIEDWEAASTLLQNLGVHAEWQGAYAQAEAHYKEGLRCANLIGHRQRISALLMNMGVLAMRQGDGVAAEALYQQSLEIAREIGHRHRMSSVLQNLGILEGENGHYQQANAWMRESLEIARDLGESWLVGETLCEWGEIYLKQDILPEAEARFEQALTIGQEAQSPLLIATTSFGLARVKAAYGAYAEARTLGEDSYARFQALGFEKTHQVGQWLAALPEA